MNFLQQSLQGLHDIAEKLNEKIKAMRDYTAFEVFVDTTEYPAGTLYRDLPEEIKMYVPSAYLNEALDYKIPAGLTVTFMLRDDHDRADSNVVVDFGDGTPAVTIQDESVEALPNETYKFTHTYSARGKYIVKILGDSYFNFQTGYIDSSIPMEGGYRATVGKCCRCLEEDLPIASCVTSIHNAFAGNPALFSVNMLDGGKLFRKLSDITNFQFCFWANYNLLQVKGFKGQKFSSYYKNEWARYLDEMFSACYNLRTCDFKAVQSIGYVNMYNACPKLSSDVTALLPDNFKEKKNIDLSGMFYNCIRLTGTVPASILWEDPEADTKFKWQGVPFFGPQLNLHFVGVEAGTAYVANKYYFKFVDLKFIKLVAGVDYNVGDTVPSPSTVYELKDLTEAEYDRAVSFLNQIPTSWGGLNEEIEAKLQAGYWKKSSDGILDSEFESINAAIQLLKDRVETLEERV